MLRGAHVRQAVLKKSDAAAQERITVKPLYITGTQKDIGKTTLSVGLSYKFHQDGLSVGYIKPLGQREKKIAGQSLHDDAVVISKILGDPSHTQAEMALALPRGRVEKEISDLHSADLREKIKKSCDELNRNHDIVIIEGMGHVAMGSCIGVSGADVARISGAKAVLVTGGGIGKTIDEVALCSEFLVSNGVEFLGAIINKVWPEKYDRIASATTQGLKNLGIRSLGVVPFQEELSNPTMRQVFDCVGGELLGGKENLDNIVHNTIVAAMESRHMIGHLKSGTLVITPGDRTDNILAALSANILGDMHKMTMAGLLLTGGFRLDATCMKLINDSGLPTILVKEDTYTVGSKYYGTVFKIAPENDRKIQAAAELMGRYVDTDAILRSLDE